MLLFEGETEVEFYGQVLDRFCPNTFRRPINLFGNYNVNNKIVDEIYKFSAKFPYDTFDVYVCLDIERLDNPAWNENQVKQRCVSASRCKQIIPILTELMIESLFFLDCAGIFKFLRVPHAQRNIKKFSNFRSLTHKDLSRLFEKHGKKYRKGYRCEGFIKSLNLQKIKAAEEISKLCSEINRRSKVAR